MAHELHLVPSANRRGIGQLTRNYRQMAKFGGIVLAAWLLCVSATPAQDEPRPADGTETQAETVKDADSDPPADSPDQPFVSLLDEKFAERWGWFSSAPDTPLDAVWRVSREPDAAEPVLICNGTPKGFLFTNQVWTDYELLLEWRYPTDADGNSGVLVYVQNETRVWPTSIQVQLHQPKAGSIFPSGDAQSDNTTESTMPNLARPTGQWNECRIVSEKGRLSVEINGRKAGEITGAIPCTGRIALQSEGSEVQFRRLKIRPLMNGTASETPEVEPDPVIGPAADTPRGS